MLPDLTLTRREDGWWIVGLPAANCPENGPYRTKAEADEDRQGLLRYFKRNPPQPKEPDHGHAKTTDTFQPTTTNSLFR